MMVHVYCKQDIVTVILTVYMVLMKKGVHQYVPRSMMNTALISVGIPHVYVWGYISNLQQGVVFMWQDFVIQLPIVVIMLMNQNVSKIHSP